MKDNISILDKILRREKLKNNIWNKEEQIEELEEKLASKNEKISELETKQNKAITEKQQAYEDRNQLQDKVAQLKDRIEKMDQESQEENIQVGKTLELRGERNVNEFVNQLSKIEYNNKIARTITFTEDTDDLEVYNEFDINILKSILPITIFEDKIGLIRTGVSTPLPVQSAENIDKSFQIQSQQFRPEGELLFGVIRSDFFVLGKYDSWDIQTIERQKSNVKGSHSKGGFSQARFERLRDEQIDEHIDKSKSILQEFNCSDKRTILVGDHQILGEFDEIADATARSDATGEPEQALKQAFNSFWSLKVYPQI